MVSSLNTRDDIYKEVTEKWGTPTFVFYEEVFQENARRVKEAIAESGLEGRVDVHVPYFTFSHPLIAQLVLNEGLGLVVQSVEEVHHLEAAGISLDKVVVSPGVSSHEDLDFYLDRGLLVHRSLTSHGSSPQKEKIVGCRIDVSPRKNQRLGEDISDLNSLAFKLKQKGKPVSLHTYPGTGSDVRTLVNHARSVVKFAYELSRKIPIARVNLGGGFAYDYEKREHFPWKQYFRELKLMLSSQNSLSDRERIVIEPGRDLLADAEDFLLKINATDQRKNQGFKRIFTDGSYVHLPSATIKNRQHTLRFFDQYFNVKLPDGEYGTICGNTTLSNDQVIPGLIEIPKSFFGGYVAVHDVGAYGAAQHMQFLNKRPAARVLVKSNREAELITRRGSYTDGIRNMILE